MIGVFGNRCKTVLFSLFSDHRPFVIFLKTQMNEMITISGVRVSDPVLSVLQKYYNLSGVRPEFVRLCYGGHELKIGHALSDYNVPREATIGLMIRHE